MPIRLQAVDGGRTNRKKMDKGDRLKTFRARSIRRNKSTKAGKSTIRPRRILSEDRSFREDLCSRSVSSLVAIARAENASSTQRSMDDRILVGNARVRCFTAFDVCRVRSALGAAHRMHTINRLTESEWWKKNTDILKIN